MRALAGYTLDQALHDSEHTIVYRSHRLADGAQVVVKLLGRDYPTPRELAKLRHEFELLRELTLPGIAHAYALEPCGNGLALILESLPGRPLSDYLESGPLPLQAALRAAAALAGIIDSIHRRQIIHKEPFAPSRNGVRSFQKSNSTTRQRWKKREPSRLGRHRCGQYRPD